MLFINNNMVQTYKIFFIFLFIFVVRKADRNNNDMIIK